MVAKKNRPLKVNMSSVWERFYRGDNINDNELDAAISETEITIEMLRSKGPKFGVIVQVLQQELSQLRSYEWGRTVFQQA